LNVFAGDIVYAKAGRDKDRPFVVLSILDSEFAMLADGRRRKVQKPKKKKLKHLQTSGCKALLIQEKLQNGTVVTNPDIKRALADFLNNHDA